MLKHKSKLFLSFTFLFSLFLSDAYCEDTISIYGHNFKVNEFLDLGDDVQISVFPQDQNIIKKDELNSYILQKLSKKDNQYIYNVCDENCFFEIFKKSLEKKDFMTSSMAIYFLEENAIERGVKEKIMDDLDTLDKQERQEVFKGIFENKEVYKNEHKNLSEYFVLLSLLDSEWVLNNAIKFLEKNEDFVVKSYNEKISQILQDEDATIKDLEDTLKSSKKLLGFSNEFSLKLEKNLEMLKDILFELNSLKRGKDFKKFDIKKFENFEFLEFIKREYVKKIYELAEKYINEKDFLNALNVLIYIPYDKRSQKTYDLLTYIFDNALFNTKLLDSENIQKLLNFAKENDWFLKKIIKFQEDKVKFLIYKKDRKNSLIELDNLLLLRKDENFSNDKLRLKLTNMLLSVGDKEKALEVFQEVKKNSAIIFSFSGIAVIFKLYIYKLFLVAIVIVLLYFLITQIRKSSLPREEEKSKEQSKKEVDKINIEDKEYQSILEYFGIKTESPTEKEIKSAYRAKIKLIHPDIIGYESHEFLTTQQKYNKLLKMIKNNK